MSEAKHSPQTDLETERLLLETAVSEARADHRAAVPHAQVRQDMLREIERLKRKTSTH